MRSFLVVVLVVIFASISFSAEKLTLDQSVQIAFEQSPVMIKTRADISAAQGAAGQAVAGFLPQLSINGSSGKYYSEPQTIQITMGGTPTAFTMGTDEQADTYRYSASLTQAVFTGGKISNSVAMASKGLQVAEEEYKKTAAEVKFNVIQAYYGVLKVQKLVELSEQSLNMAESHLDYVDSMQKIGMTTRADVLRAEVQKIKAEIGFTKAKQGLELARNNFNNTLGRDLSASVDLAEVEDVSPDALLYDYEDLLKIAYDYRPDWKQYVLAGEISKNEVWLASSSLWPMISLVGNYDVGSTKYSSYTSDTRNWTAVVSGSWNLFDGTATFHKIREAKAKLESQKASEISVKRSIALEVKNANFALKSAKENLTSARKAQELAEENFEIAELRYKSGLGSNLEEIDAQVALTQARVDYLQAQHDLLIAKARINKVIGGEIYR